MSEGKKVYARNMGGLIDACFDQMQDLRDGISTANEAIAFAKVADIVIKSAVITHRYSDTPLSQNEQVEHYIEDRELERSPSGLARLR